MWNCDRLLGKVFRNSFTHLPSNSSLLGVTTSGDQELFWKRTRKCWFENINQTVMGINMQENLRTWTYYALNIQYEGHLISLDASGSTDYLSSKASTPPSSHDTSSEMPSEEAGGNAHLTQHSPWSPSPHPRPASPQPTHGRSYSPSGFVRNMDD